MAITAVRPRRNARHDVNNFWWTDLQTSDPVAAADFYSKVLGWDFVEVPTDLGPVYRIAQLDGLKIAGLGPIPPDAVANGARPSWTNYILVEDCDAVCARATELGGTVAMPAMDVMEEGRMALIVDPTGALVGIWQARNMVGADAVNQPSTYGWSELATTDIEVCRTFYGALFGWGWEEGPSAGAMPYFMWTKDGVPFAGLFTKPAEMAQMPNAWMTYFGVSDIQATVAEVTASGGTVMFGPDRMGPGIGAGIVDPQGGTVMFIQLDEWPS